jgi:lysyl endopeptidase
VPINISTPGFSLSFFHRFDLESTFDGAVLEYSLDGSTWFDILAGNGGTIPANANRFTAGAYASTISTNATFQSPILGRRAWSGNSNTFINTTVDLSDFAGNSIQLRWRQATDTTVTRVGWWIDDIRISAPTACNATLPDPIFYDGFETLVP